MGATLGSSTLSTALHKRKGKAWDREGRRLLGASVSPGQSSSSKFLSVHHLWCEELCSWVGVELRESPRATFPGRRQGLAREARTRPGVALIGRHRGGNANLEL